MLFWMRKSNFYIFMFQKISEIAHAHGALVLVDNSIMSPVLSRPLELGAGTKHELWKSDFTNYVTRFFYSCFNSDYLNFLPDIVMHSATKFIAGHSDLMAGVLAVKGERLCIVLFFVIDVMFHFLSWLQYRRIFFFNQLGKGIVLSTKCRRVRVSSIRLLAVSAGNQDDGLTNWEATGASLLPISPPL